MNKQFAIEILEMVERKTLERNCHLVKEAFRYLERLKKTDSKIIERIYKIKYS